MEGTIPTPARNFYREYIPPPPFRKVSEEVSPQEGDPYRQRGDIHVDEKGKLMRSFMEYAGITRDLIASFDNWLENLLPKQLLSAPVYFNNGMHVMFENLSVEPPTIRRDRGEVPLTPNMAREKSVTYAARLRVDMVLYSVENMEVERLENVELGYIPIMLGCAACHLRNKSEQEKMEMGECAKDPMG